jgi:hypothetical protein
MNNILPFAGRLIEESGGDVEWHPSGNYFQALLPDDACQRLGLPQPLVTISDTANAEEEPGRIPIGFGTELLDRAIIMAMDLGRAAAVRMPALSVRKQSEPDIAGAFAFPNSTFQVKGNHESWIDYWRWSFEVAADADERNETVQLICLSSLGVNCPHLPKLIFEQALDWEPLTIKESEIKNSTLENLFLIACDRVIRQSDEHLTEFKETLTRHHIRDIHRIETYFQTLSNEMEAEIHKRQLQGTELDIRKEKIRQLEAEKIRKLNALKDKYRLHLTITPSALLLARISVRRFDLLVKRRKGERRISVVYNLLSKTFDAMACESCGRDTYSLGFCDEGLHILCATCLTRFTDEKTCPGCRGNRPPSNVARVLRRLGIEKSGGGKTSVEEL